MKFNQKSAAPFNTFCNRTFLYKSQLHLSIDKQRLRKIFPFKRIIAYFFEIEYRMAQCFYLDYQLNTFLILLLNNLLQCSSKTED